MPEEAVDLVDKLLQLNPLERLGGGPPGSKLDFEALKSHEFFKGINFARIASGNIAPPIPVD
jgi:3-phosphoinositide dependent protein kinase-1